jgi:hypothetical protein
VIAKRVTIEDLQANPVNQHTHGPKEIRCGIEDMPNHSRQSLGLHPEQVVKVVEPEVRERVQSERARKQYCQRNQGD